MKIKLNRQEAIRANIKSFSKLSPSAKIRYVEEARKQLKYFRSLTFSSGKDNRG